MTTLRSWECLNLSRPTSVGTTMLVTRANDHPMGAGPTDKVAVARRVARERAVVELERTHGQILFGFVRRLGVSDAAAADVVQESLLRLFDALNAGQPIRDSKSWTFHVAYRLAMDEHRRLARGQRLSGLGHCSPDEHDPAADMERREVWSEVDRLPERQRAVLYLRFRADLAFKDIGTTLGITASAARSHCSQALAVLRDRLGEEGR